MNVTKIAWTDFSWNPASGCAKITAGCKHCYAHSFAERLRGGAAFPNGFDLTLRPHKLTEPAKVKDPSLIFVNSMSDLFFDQISDGYRERIFEVMRQCPQHRFQVLTKRPEAMLAWTDKRGPMPSNVWAGVTIEHNATAYRADILRNVDCETRFISAEPLLDDLAELDLTSVDWLIVGGESGRHLTDPSVRAVRGLADYGRGRWFPRPDREQWVRGLVERAAKAGVPAFFKQWGGVRPESAGALLDGRTVKEWPVQAMPTGR